jgi:hypothetical protein
LAAGCEFVTNFNESLRLPFAVTPGLAKREPGIHYKASYAARWIPGLRPNGRISDAQLRIGE